MLLGTRFLNRLAAASFALGSCASLPSETLAAWVEDELDGEPDTTPLDAVNNAGRMAAGARAAVSAFWPKSHEASEVFVTQLLEQKSLALRIAAAAALGQVLELASPIERIEIVCRWTVSENPAERLTVARALSLPTQVFVTDLAIGELAQDPNPDVRAAAARAARAHAQSHPDGFERILSELSQDPERVVRAAARQAGVRDSFV